jgi:hypothetical protein
MKVMIRVLLVSASACMVAGNWEAKPESLLASCLFLVANLMALVMNGWKK